MKKPKTICVKCEHHRIFDLPNSSVWWAHRCKAKPQPAAIDPVTGKRQKPGLPYCRDINDGDCALYGRK